MTRDPSDSNASFGLVTGPRMRFGLCIHTTTTFYSHLMEAPLVRRRRAAKAYIWLDTAVITGPDPHLATFSYVCRYIPIVCCAVLSPNSLGTAGTPFKRTIAQARVTAVGDTVNTTIHTDKSSVTTHT